RPAAGGPVRALLAGPPVHDARPHGGRSAPPRPRALHLLLRSPPDAALAAAVARVRRHQPRDDRLLGARLLHRRGAGGLRTHRLALHGPLPEPADLRSGDDGDLVAAAGLSEAVSARAADRH